MATVYIPIDVAGVQFDATSPAAPIETAGSNFPVRGLAFDASADEIVYFALRAINYGSGDWTLEVDWYADTASSGGVTWSTQVAAITPNTDSQDIETDTFDTADTGDDTHLGTTGQRLHRATVTMQSANLDSVAADDWVTVKLFRDVSDANDDMTGDAIVVGLTISYSDA